MLHLHEPKIEDLFSFQPLFVQLELHVVATEEQETIDNVTPSDRFYGKDKEILEQRQRTKTETMNQRRKIYRSFLINNLMGDLN